MASSRVFPLFASVTKFMPLIFAEIPKWMQRRSTVAYRRLGLKDWTVTVSVSESATNGNAGFILMQAQYRTAEIFFHPSLRNDDEGSEVVQHEFTHLLFADVQRIISDHYPKNAKNRKAVIHEIDCQIESIIKKIYELTR